MFWLTACFGVPNSSLDRMTPSGTLTADAWRPDNPIIGTGRRDLVRQRKCFARVSIAGSGIGSVSSFEVPGASQLRIVVVGPDGAFWMADLNSKKIFRAAL